MSDLRTAAQQALEFIRWSQYVPCQSEAFPEPPSTAPQVEAALRAALAEPPIDDPHRDHWVAIAEAAQKIAASTECGLAEAKALCAALDRLTDAALAEPQIDDPASHFCHRFAILMECLLLTKDINGYWDEANDLLSEYNSARDKWMEAQGQPYVSGFGKD